MNKRGCLAYAKALFDLAKEEDSVAIVKEDFRIVLAFFASKEGEEALRFLSSFALSYKQKEKVLIDGIFPSLHQSCFKPFLQLLLSKNLFHWLAAIEEEYHALANPYLHIAEGIVYSAEPLSEKQMDNVVKAVSKKIAASVELENRIDSRLIGGVKVYVDGRLFDYSVEGKIEMLRNKLLAGGKI